MKEVNPETGEMSFKGFSLRQMVTVLHSSFQFSEEMPEGHERGIIHRAIRSTAQTGKITPERLLRAIVKGEKSFARVPRESFMLVTSLSAGHFKALTSREVSGGTITFDRYLPDPFGDEHEKARMIAEDQVIGQLPRLGANPMWSYVPTKISVRARSHQEAFERAIDALDLLRGVWNLALNRNRGPRHSIGIRKPVNRLILGPIHSLHDPDGRLVDESPWIEDDYVGALVTFNLVPDWEYVEEYEQFVWQELSRIPYRQDLEASIRRYARALDRRDWNTSFVRLWGLLVASYS
jgi:hypothetical protein